MITICEFLNLIHTPPSADSLYTPDKSYSNFIIYSAANFSQFRTLDDGRKFPAVSLLVGLQEIQADPKC